jgi:hypothetical protein
MALPTCDENGKRPTYRVARGIGPDEWEEMERKNAGLPPRVSRDEAERLAVAMNDYADLFRPIICRLTGGSNGERR